MMWKQPFSEFLLLLLLSTLIFPSITPHSIAQNLNSGYEIRDGIKWHPTERLTWIGDSRNPQIARDGVGNYHIVWQDNRDGNWEIYYLKVNLDGFKLLNDTRITKYDGDDINPSMVSTQNTVFIVWQRLVNSHWAIYFSRISYTDENIMIEVPPKPIVQGDYNCTDPKITIDYYGNLHLVWQDDRNGNWDIMYELIDKNGNPKGSIKDVSSDKSDSIRPNIVVDRQENSHIFWIDVKSVPGYSLLYRKLSLDGKFLTGVKKISIVSPQSTLDAFYYNNSLYVTFSCSREDLAYEIIYTQLNSVGDTVIDDKNLTPLDSKDSILPSLNVRDDAMFVVWNDIPQGTVRFSSFNLNGGRRGEIFNISEEKAFNPAMDTGERSIGIVWEKDINGRRYLYFRSGEFPNLQVKKLSIKEIGENLTLSATFQSTFPLTVEYCVCSEENEMIYSAIFIEMEKRISLNFTLSPGTHNITVYLDPKNYIVEYSEEDNFKSQSIFVKSFSFQIEVSNFTIEAGERKNVSFYIINEGNWEDNYSVSITYNTSFFSLNYSKIIENVTPGERREIIMEIEAFSCILSSSYEFFINVTSLQTHRFVERKISGYVLPFSNLTIGFTPRIEIQPGKWGYINISLYNNGNSRETYFLSFREDKPWPFQGGGENITLNPGDAWEYKLKIYVPQNTPAYEKNMVNITIHSSTITRYANIVLVVKPVYAVSAEILSIVKKEESYKITASIKNTGNIATLFNLNLSGEISSFTMMSSSHLFLQPQENASVVFNVYLPPTLMAGTYPLYINILHDNITLQSLQVKLSVEERHFIKINIEKIQEGTSIKFGIEIKNEGNAPDVVKIQVGTINLNATWLISYQGKNYTNETAIYLKPNETAYLVAILTTPLKEGTHSVLLHFTSASGLNRTMEEKFFVGIKKKSFLDQMLSFILGNILYIGIAAGAVGGILIYKFKLKK